MVFSFDKCNTVAYTYTMSDLVNIMILAFIGGVLALGGGVVFLTSKKLAKVLTSYSVPFAAGVLLTVALLGLIPEAVHALGESAYLIVLISFLTAYVFENFVFGIHHHERERHTHGVESSVPFVIIGDSLHNFVDGVAIAATYLVNPGLGLITTVSTFLHEVPHEVADFGILLKAGWKKKYVFWVNLLSASAIFLGAFFVIVVGNNNVFVGILLGFSAGLFLYLGATDFLPHIHESMLTPARSVLALLLGVLVMVAVFSLVPHAHEGEDIYGYNDEIHEQYTEGNRDISFLMNNQ